MAHKVLEGIPEAQRKRGEGLWLSRPLRSVCGEHRRARRDESPNIHFAKPKRALQMCPQASQDAAQITPTTFPNQNFCWACHNQPGGKVPEWPAEKGGSASCTQSLSLSLRAVPRDPSPSSYLSSFPHGARRPVQSVDLAGQWTPGDPGERAAVSQGTRASTLAPEASQRAPAGISGRLLVRITDYAQNVPFVSHYCCHFFHLLQTPLSLSPSSVRKTNFPSSLRSFLSNKSFSDRPGTHTFFVNTRCHYCSARCPAAPGGPLLVAAARPHRRRHKDRVL